MNKCYLSSFTNKEVYIANTCSNNYIAQQILGLMTLCLYFLSSHLKFIYKILLPTLDHLVYFMWSFSVFFIEVYNQTKIVPGKKKVKETSTKSTSWRTIGNNYLYTHVLCPTYFYMIFGYFQLYFSEQRLITYIFQNYQCRNFVVCSKKYFCLCCPALFF